MPNEQEQFLKDLENDPSHSADPFDYLQTSPEEGAAPVEAPAPAEDEEGDVLSPKNRRERRLLARYQAERETAIELAARLAALEEAKAERANADSAEDSLKAIERIYGTDSPEAREDT